MCLLNFSGTQRLFNMFTGIITNLGTVTAITPQSNSDQIFHIKPLNSFSVTKGDSISCSGACLTIVDTLDDGTFTVQVSQETIKVTNLNTWKVGKKINLEQAIRLSDTVDGHL